MNTVTANGLVIFGWGVAAFLVYSLLSGPFDGRACETLCFNMLYWAALVLAVLGTLLSFVQSIKPDSGLFSKVSLLFGLILSAKLIGVMVIGVIST